MIGEIIKEEIRPGTEPGASDISTLGRKEGTRKGNCKRQHSEAGEKSRE